MEIVSPLFFLYTFFKSPLSYHSPPLPPLISPQTILVFLYCIHYANRAILSPLRTPSRSKSHIIVPLSAIFFNTVNGSLMGSYLSSPVARIFLGTHSFSRPSFYLGIAIWALGFAGNIWHDEILLDIRRKAKSKGKGKATEDDTTPGNVDKADAPHSPKPKVKRVQPEYYAIPQGWLYDYVSYPNYLCEWLEWFGFALAAGPFPFVISSFSWKGLFSLFSDHEYLFAPNLTPPYIFFLSEVFLMFPRAYRGHQWYKMKFKDSYPKERKIVVPFLL